MEVYVLDRNTLETLSIQKPIDYGLNLDEETNGVSTLVLASFVGVEKGNFIVLNGLFKQFIFVISEVTSENENTANISMLDITNIFDRKIIEKNTSSMTTDGIEKFIGDTIYENFINSDDLVLNIDYIDIYTHTNTLANVNTFAENGLYNLHTFITNCRQYRNVYTEFSLIKENGKNRFRIDIRHKDEETLLVDTTLEEVTNYNKIYEVDPVTKVQAFIRADNSVYELYLRSDRTTTTNKNDPNRLVGRIEVISCEDYESAVDEALNTIKANTYTHLVQFQIPKTSKLMDVSKLTIGRPIKIKTKDSIYDSYISAVQLSDNNFVSFKTGNLRIDFTDKQRQSKQVGTVGNKLDVSGGVITGSLKVEGDLKMNGISVVESGSNANGRWIKYADGTMICLLNTTLDMQAYVAWGNLYANNSAVDLRFPQSFIETPYVSITVQNTTNSVMVIDITATNQGITRISCCRPNWSGTISAHYVITAIGRWK